MSAGLKLKGVWIIVQDFETQQHLGAAHARTQSVMPNPNTSTELSYSKCSITSGAIHLRSHKQTSTSILPRSLNTFPSPPANSALPRNVPSDPVHSTGPSLEPRTQ